MATHDITFLDRLRPGQYELPDESGNAAPDDGPAPCPPQPRPNMPERIRCLDAIRGFASLGVLTYHTVNTLTDELISPGVAFVKQTVLGVISLGLPGMRIPLFFMISGFANHLKFARTKAAGKTPRVEARGYLSHRLRKLYPAYVVALTVSCGLLLGGMLRGVPLSMVGLYPGNRYLFLGLDYLSHLLFLHGFFPYFDRGAGNGPLWTMAREAQFCLLYFPLLAVRRRWSVWFCAVLALLASAVSLSLANSLETSYPVTAYAIGTSSLAYWPFWVFGMVAVELTYGLARGPGRYVSLMAFAAAGYVYARDSLGTSEVPFLHLVLLAVTLFFLVRFLVSSELAGNWPSCAAIRGLEIAGKYSYHTFLIHFPVVVILGRWARNWATGTSVVAFAVASLGIVVIALAHAVILKKSIDKFFREADVARSR